MLEPVQKCTHCGANLTLDEGLHFCARGEADTGLLFLARGLRLAVEARDPNLERVARGNLAAWRTQWIPLRAERLG